MNNQVNIDRLWKLTLEDLQVSTSAAGFTSWIRPLTLTGLNESEGGNLVAEIACPSPFHRKIIEQRYRDQIKEALGRLSEQEIELNFEIAAEETVSSAAMGPLFSVAQPAIDELSLSLHRVGLREDFTFESFAVSSSNEMAHAAASAVADHFGRAYNPLFLYGGVGVGKTHLSQAVAIKVLGEEPKTPMIFCMGEEFTNEIIEAIQQKKTREFRQRYRQVKGLFIDDIQFIAGKTTVQEEFFHTFNAVLKGGGQVVMTSDRPPQDIPALEARLRSRFEAGLLVDIGRPDFELRTAITLIKAGQRKIELKMQDAQTIAANIDSARKIEGFLVRLTTESKLRKRPIDSTLVAGLLGKTTTKEDTPPPLRPVEVIKGIADHFKITPKELKGGRRIKQIVTPRHLAMYLLRVDYNLPFADIGMLFSGRDHTTVMHAVDKITHQLKDSEALRMDLTEVRKGLYQ